MTFGRKYLLCSAAGAAMSLPSALALAGEPPVKTGGTPYVRQCVAEGPGFYYAPGTDTCIRFGGYVWAEGYYNTYTNIPLTDPKTYTIGTYGMQVDARTQTEYGLLRAFADIRFQYRTADEWGAALPGSARAQANPWMIYTQFAGFTFGYTTSLFDFYANQNIYGTDPATIGDQAQITVLAYTWEMGNGWTTTVSLEDSNERSPGIQASDVNVPASYVYKNQVPEIIGAFGQTGKWGQFQLSGALHRVDPGIALDSEVYAPWSQMPAQSTWGYALQAGVMFNLPMITPGDTLYLQTAYVDGAVSYLGLINPSGDFAPPDAFVNPDGSLSKVSGWNMTAQFLHNITPTWQVTAFGGYAKFDLNSTVASSYYGASGGTNYNVGGSLAWLPLSSFGLILQYEYNVYEADNYINTGYGLPVPSQKAHQVLLMAQRTF